MFFTQVRKDFKRMMLYTHTHTHVHKGHIDIIQYEILEKNDVLTLE
jgi:hypothetical protein